MMFLMLIAQAVTPLPAPLPPAADSMETRYDRCVDLATVNPPEGVVEGTQWRASGGGFFARQCIGIAYANQAKWAPAAEEFEAAAQEAEVARNNKAAQFWAQAGNARLAAGDVAKARAALDAALAAGTLVGLERGEAQFDRARAMVAAGELEGARNDIDQALTSAGEDPLIWLASATLARRMDDLPRARKDIAEAFRRSSDDPSVYLEIGNIAALGGDADGAKSAWNDAVRVAPSSEAAANARNALKQFADPPQP